jgi:hypothetical protein
VRIEPVLGEERGDAVVLELERGRVDAPLRECTLVELEVDDLDDVDRGEPATDHDRAVLQLEPGPCVALLVAMVVPVDQRVLVHEPAAEVSIRVGEQRTIAPGAARQQHRDGAPALAQLRQRDVFPQPRARDEQDAGTVQVGVDVLVLFAPQLVVPAWEPVFDLPVGSVVLLEHDRQDAALRA